MSIKCETFATKNKQKYLPIRVHELVFLSVTDRYDDCYVNSVVLDTNCLPV